MSLLAPGRSCGTARRPDRRPGQIRAAIATETTVNVEEAAAIVIDADGFANANVEIETSRTALP
ncbi:MAG: hypothetical protein FJX57_24530 [Alphaproteobacteria bacterium]|nr:hypothetical protein [Alphaproteobacteria bacterium]